MKAAAARPGDTRRAVLLSRWLDWRAMLTVVTPDTLIRWHRQGWRLARLLLGATEGVVVLSQIGDTQHGDDRSPR
jgi:hypothetical protein